MISVDAVLQLIAGERDCASTAPLAQLVRVLRPRHGEDAHAASMRVRALVDELARHPDHAHALAVHLEAVLTARYQRFAFAESGVLTDERFASGVLRRIVARVNPCAPRTRPADGVLATVFDRPDDHAWLAAVPDETWDALRETLARAEPRQPTLRRHVQREMLAALRMLSQRLAALGLSPAIVRGNPSLAGHDSPFVAQGNATDAFVSIARMAIVDPHAPRADSRRMCELLEQCLACAERGRETSASNGAGLQVVYAVVRIEQVVARMSLLARLVAPDPARADELTSEYARLLIGIVRAENRRHRVGDLVRENSRIVANYVLRHLRQRAASFAGSS